MYNNPYFMSGFRPSMMNPNLMRGASSAVLNGTRSGIGSSLVNGARSGGLLSRLGAGLSGFKTINWGGLINNTSKTLGIINQTIPLVRQVGPVVNNMKSMLRIASVFKDETDIRKNNSYDYNYQNKIFNSNSNNTLINNNTLDNNSKLDYNYEVTDYSDAPTFFIDT